MNKLIFCIAILIFPVLGYSSIIKKDLSDAIKDNSIKLDAENMGSYTGKTTQLKLTNLTKTVLQVKVNIGVILKPEEAEYQPMVLAGEEIIVVMPSSTASIEVMTFCGNSPKWGPSKGLHYSFSHLASDTLMKILRFIKTNSLFDDLGQHAVWAITNKHDLSQIYDPGRDVLSKKLIELVSQNTGRPLPSYYTMVADNQVAGQPAYVPKTLKIIAEFEVLLEVPKVLTLGIYNEEGKMIQKVFEQQEFSAMGHRFSVEFEAENVPAGMYYIRLKEGDKITQEKMVKAE